MAKPIQVMIVDDSEDTRQSLCMMLSLTNSIEVIAEAKDGAEAIQKLSVVTPDVILMDVNMPVLDGVQATERISLQYPNLSVIVLSVQNDAEYVQRCMRAGAKDYLFKPVTVETLTETIESVYMAGQERPIRSTVAVLAEHSTKKSAP
ncbi:MAG: response regulator transcription factor [Alicyclobacillus sp.]|nr:response regulator transcription factor [Alicyclobacillus sp.]